jgi:hypothetical protein
MESQSVPWFMSGNCDHFAGYGRGSADTDTEVMLRITMAARIKKPLVFMSLLLSFRFFREE